MNNGLSQPIKVLLYYKYVPLSNPEEIKIWQKELCLSLNLKGRIIIADEGLNGTLAGETTQVDEYISQTQLRPEFKDLEWKISYAETQVFPKLRVVVRDEIVTLGFKKKGSDVAIDNKAEYIQPAELEKLYANQADFIIIDARNNYEAEIGKFENAIIPPIENFRDFPAFAEKELSQYKERDVITYCTGGVRCEKASAYLREQGFKKVRQLHGGIHEYCEQTGGTHFEGELFVFDQRLHVPVNKIAPTTISSCIYCHKPLTRYIDCVAPACDGLFICCESCQEEHQAACSTACEDKITLFKTPENNQL